MLSEDIKSLIEQEISGSQATVTGDGSHFEVVVVSDAFEGLSMVDEQRMVYAALNEMISSGAIHALSIKAYTPGEWQTASKLHVAGD